MLRQAIVEFAKFCQNNQVADPEMVYQACLMQAERQKAWENHASDSQLNDMTDELEHIFR